MAFQIAYSSKNLLTKWKSLALAMMVCLFSANAYSGALPAQDPTPAEDTPAVEPLVPEADQPDSLEALSKKYPEIAEAIEKFKARDFDATLELAKQAAAKHDDLPPGEVFVASLYFAARDINSAMRMLDKAVQTSPADPSAYLDLANIALLQNRLTETTLLLDKSEQVLKAFSGNAERVKKSNNRLLVARASLSEKKEEWTEAEKLLQKLIEENPEDAGLVVRHARAMFRNKQGKAAYEKLKASKSIATAEIAPELVIAQFYTETEDDANAKRWLDFAVKKSPKDLKVRLGALQWNWQRGNASAVEEHALAAVTADAASVPARLFYGMYAHYSGDLDVAAAQYEAVLTRDPNNFSARNSLALVLADRAQADSLIRAKRIAEENLQANPNNTVAAGTLAWTHFKLGQFEESGKLMQAVSQAGGLNNLNNIYIAARVADRAGQRDQAIQLVKQTLEQPQLFEMRGAAKKWLQSVEPKK